MLFQIYGETALYQLLGFVLVFTGLVLANEFARRTKTGGIICFLVLPAVLTVYFVAIAIGAHAGAEWWSTGTKTGLCVRSTTLKTRPSAQSLRPTCTCLLYTSPSPRD